jgi:NADPH:quinone reductase-like Zn-dependent oxidoreductase
VTTRADILMKAIRIHERGGPEQLIYEDAPKSVPRCGDALVRVLAAGVTPTELSWPSAYTSRDNVDRLPAIPGHEFAGVVEVTDRAAADRSPIFGGMVLTLSTLP